jgi:chromosome partitioning protein
VVLGEWSGELGELVTPVAGLWLVPTTDAMFLLEPQLYTRTGREWLLARFVDSLIGMLDDVLIDCPPSLGALTDSALIAARGRDDDEDVVGQVVIPVQAEDSSIRALSLLLRQIATLQDALRVRITPVGLVINGYDRRRGRVAISTAAAFERYELPVLATVPDRKDIREAWRLHKTVLAHAPESDQAQAFRALSRAVTPELAQEVAQ